MNWRQGFFRLWLLLAVLWWGGWGVHYFNIGSFGTKEAAIVVTLLSGEKIEFPQGTPQDVMNRVTKEENEKSGYSGTPQKEAAKDAPAKNIPNWQQAPLVKDVPYGGEQEKRAGRFPDWPAAVIPPFALLALSWAIAWVLTGFKRGET